MKNNFVDYRLKQLKARKKFEIQLKKFEMNRQKKQEQQEKELVGLKNMSFNMFSMVLIDF